jgi:hypothetical protein
MGRLDAAERGAIGGLLRLLHQLAFQQPHQRVEPEQGDGQPGHHQRRPVAADHMGHFMGQHGVCIFRPVQRIAVDQDHRAQPAPAERRRRLVGNEQPNGLAAALRHSALHRGQPDRIGERPRRPRPAAQGDEPADDARGHHQQPAQIQDRDQARRIVPDRRRHRLQRGDLDRGVLQGIGLGRQRRQRLGRRFDLQRRQQQRDQRQQQQQADAQPQDRRPIGRAARAQQGGQAQRRADDQCRFPRHFPEECEAHFACSPFPRLLARSIAR